MSKFYDAIVSRSIVVPILIAMNAIVYLMWSFVEPQWMYSHFLINGELLMWGHWSNLITSVFSHNMFLHILFNMMVLNSFGPLIENVLGKFQFILFYVLAGLVSSISHVLVSALFMGSLEIPALGASGAISGLVILFALIFPKEKLLLFGIIPVPALLGAMLFILLDLWGLVAQAQGGGLPIGHGAHLGGSLTGVLFYFLYYRKRRNKLLRYI